MSMSVDELRNVVLLFSNPSWSDSVTIPTTIIRNLTALSSDIAYSAFFQDNLTVLTSKYAETTNGIIQGLLYVPDLTASDDCVTKMEQYVPESAVRQVNLPPNNYNLIALIPWIDPNCTKHYLASARTDPLRAMVVYRPDNSSDAPPDANSEQWDLSDGGRWKTENHYPIYAVSGAVGGEMMNQLSLYSGNVTDVPFGDNISDLYSPDSDAYVRIWTELAVSTSSNIPGIWVFFPVIAGVLIAVVLTTSFLMHFVQGRRRASLRRRVMTGEVNLEGMGIRRLTVPTDHIQKFPLFTYHYELDDRSPPNSPISPSSATVTRISRPGDSKRSNKDPTETIVATSTNGRALTVSEKELNSVFGAPSTVATDYQPMCVICLEPFKNRVTIIREISCGHIFHPECIDEFLGENSSLCPICKTSMLPKGYCPKITNAMVRRERAIRRLRDRIVVEETDEESLRTGRMKGWGSSIKRRLFSNSASQAAAGGGTEMRSQRPLARLNITRESLQRRAGGATGMDLTRARMRQLAGSPLYDDEGSVSKWKSMRNKVFPGFS